MKKSDKGFVLAESIVVAVFVLGMFTYLALNIFPLISKYDKAINYDGPNEIYLANTLYDELSSSIDVCDLVENNTSVAFPSNAVLPEDLQAIMKIDYYTTLITYLKVKGIVVYKENVQTNLLTRGMREYFNYSKKKYEDDNKVKLLVEFEGGRFASVEGETCS